MSMIKKYTDEEYESSKWDGKLKLECEHCHKDFWKSAKKVKLYLRGNSKQRNLDKCQFCSLKCAGLAKTSEKKEYVCKRCGKVVFRRGSEIEPSGNIFCSKSCSATLFNEEKGTKEFWKNRSDLIRKTYNTKFPKVQANCIQCGAIFLRSPACGPKTCSKDCRSAYKSAKVRPIATENIIEDDVKHETYKKSNVRSPTYLYSLEEAKEHLSLFVEEHGRIPGKREKNDLRRFANRHFGTWNKMILHFGYTPMTKNLRRKRIKCSDGHIVDSVSEKIIDEFLTSHNISHEVHKRYNDSKLISDFFLTDHNVYVEYFGLDGGFVKYDENTQKKLKLFEDNNLKVVTVYPKDLFPKNRLNEVFKLWILS